jgi:hypothetical protein
MYPCSPSSHPSGPWLSLVSRTRSFQNLPPSSNLSPVSLDPFPLLRGSTRVGFEMLYLLPPPSPSRYITSFPTFSRDLSLPPPPLVSSPPVHLFPKSVPPLSRPVPDPLVWRLSSFMGAGVWTRGHVFVSGWRVPQSHHRGSQRPLESFPPPLS